MNMNGRKILVTQSDMQKLVKLLELRGTSQARDQQHLEMLAQELERADVVPSEDIPADVITMHSHVRVRDLETRREIGYTLVFPDDADINENKISVLAPIGTALLGYRKGDEIEWPVPGGVRLLKVVEILYQPEAAGDEPGQRVAGHRIAGAELHGRSSATSARGARSRIEAR
jgi:regulator of nucleoside diphosphate kinase